MMISLATQQTIWKVGISAGERVRRAHTKQHKLLLGKTLLDEAFFHAIEQFSEKPHINCFVTGFVNGYLSV